MTDTPDLDELRELESKATDGPWCATPGTMAGKVWVSASGEHIVLEPIFSVRCDSGGSGRSQSERFDRKVFDAAFIVAARNSMRWLLDTHAAQREEIDRLKLRSLNLVVRAVHAEHDLADAIKTMEGAKEYLKHDHTDSAWRLIRDFLARIEGSKYCLVCHTLIRALKREE